MLVDEEASDTFFGPMNADGEVILYKQLDVNKTLIGLLEPNSGLRRYSSTYCIDTTAAAAPHRWFEGELVREEREFLEGGPSSLYSMTTINRVQR